jgi:hypothetical protein
MGEIVSGLDIQQCFQTTGVVTDDGAVLVLNGGAAVYLKKKRGTGTSGKKSIIIVFQKNIIINVFQEKVSKKKIIATSTIHSMLNRTHSNKYIGTHTCTA